jgi:hypothetical protein
MNTEQPFAEDGVSLMLLGVSGLCVKTGLVFMYSPSTVVCAMACQISKSHRQLIC